MNIFIKIFLTYASISMFSGIVYAFVYGTIVGVSNISVGIFLFLWIGPLALCISIGLPILLWKMWMLK